MTLVQKRKQKKCCLIFAERSALQGRRLAQRAFQGRSGGLCQRAQVAGDRALSVHEAASDAAG